MLAVLAILSLLIQLANVALVVRLVGSTGRRPAWMFIAAAMALAAVLRFVTVLRFYSSPSAPTTPMHEIFVIVISVLLMVGLYLIYPMVQSIRAAERTVRQSEEQYRSFFESSPLAVIICHDGRIEYANRSAMKVLGAERSEQIMRWPLNEFVHRRFHPLVSQQLQTLSEAHPAHPITEIQAVRADGLVVDVEAMISLFIYGGNLAQYVVLWDVTDRKRREEELRDRESELAHVTRLHTMGEIAAEMAHEINQPLYAISNFAQAGILHLQSGDANRVAQLGTCLDHVHAQAARAAQIVKNLRNFVSKSTGELRRVPYHKVVRDALELVAAEARRKRAVVELELEQQDAVLHADPIQIQQVLVNLLVNAFESMETLPEVNRRVRIVTRTDSENVDIAVEDSGPGVPEENLSRIFEPFFTSKAQGMGMGLAVSRTIVIRHGGSIHAERNERGGTSFLVSLPRFRDAESASPA
jgi:PAS domain S-box-containing protein